MKCAFTQCPDQASRRGVCPRHLRALFGGRNGDPNPNLNPVEAYRKKRGWSQEQFAQHMGCAVRTVWDWENKRPPPYIIYAIYGLEWVEDVQRQEQASVEGKRG